MSYEAKNRVGFYWKSLTLTDRFSDTESSFDKNKEQSDAAILNYKVQGKYHREGRRGVPRGVFKLCSCPSVSTFTLLGAQFH